MKSIDEVLIPLQHESVKSPYGTDVFRGKQYHLSVERDRVVLSGVFELGEEKERVVELCDTEAGVVFRMASGADANIVRVEDALGAIERELSRPTIPPSLR